MVVIGDSLIRNARDQLQADLAAAGYDPVFVCWGGKTLEWGTQQVGHLRDLGVLPTCVVFNLGTNDLKGTTAAGLADAVDVDTVDARLQQLLAAVADVPDIFIVNLAADLTTAPSTMSDVSQTVDRYTDSVISSGIGDVVDWAGATRLQSGLIGPDGIHDSVQGQRVRSALITEAVSRDCQ